MHLSIVCSLAVLLVAQAVSGEFKGYGMHQHSTSTVERTPPTVRPGVTATTKKYYHTTATPTEETTDKDTDAPSTEEPTTEAPTVGTVRPGVTTRAPASTKYTFPTRMTHKPKTSTTAPVTKTVGTVRPGVTTPPPTKHHYTYPPRTNAPSTTDDTTPGEDTVPPVTPGVPQTCQSCQRMNLPAPAGGCSGPDCVIYDMTTQAICTEVDNASPTSDQRWVDGLNLNVDQDVLQGEIVAYKIQWSSGWSQWFVPGTNDLDIKVNGCGMRRMWSYFFDHTHSYIICK